MPRFNKSMMHDFKDFFYHECRCVHDAEVVGAEAEAHIADSTTDTAWMFHGWR